MKIGIVGNGAVGRSLTRLFSTSSNELVIYDKYEPAFNGPDKRNQINGCDLVFISVPTPTATMGTDLSAVHEVVSWIERPMCIKSTVPPGTTNHLVTTTGKEIVFSPEYIGETPYHPYRTEMCCDFIAIGGVRKVTEKFLSLYKSALGPQPRYFVTDATTAELAKYMENCFFATKVAFVAQFYLLARKFGADFDQMREIWVADPRIGHSHSAVIGSLGFSGKCLPKDLAAIILAAKSSNVNIGLLEAVQKFNYSLMAELESDGQA
jgi:UDPglucose 6-dehydrogenase